MGKSISPLIVGVTAWLIVSQIILPNYEETLKPVLVDKVHPHTHSLSACVYVSV
jgi:hypothetical protein